LVILIHTHKITDTFNSSLCKEKMYKKGKKMELSLLAKV